MNCPHHIEVFKHHVIPYRELPIRIAEIGMMHRCEKSGALTGLQRPWNNLNDGHLVCTPEQIEEEFKKILQLIIDVYEDFKLDWLPLPLVLPWPWRQTQNTLITMGCGKCATHVESSPWWYGCWVLWSWRRSAAFYGPKLDIQVKTASVKKKLFLLSN